MWKQFLSKNRSRNQLSADAAQQEGERVVPISPHLSYNLKRIEETFCACKDLIILPWSYGPGLEQKAFSVYFDTLVQEKKLNYMKETLQDLVPHEVGQATTITAEDVIHYFTRHGVSSQTAIKLNDFDQAVQHILDGDVVIFFDQWNQVLAYNALGLSSRQVTEPVMEPVVQGPHMSTIEDIGSNIGLIRNLLKSPKLKFNFMTTGEETRRQIAYGYLDGAVNPETLTEFERRMADLDREEILETSYLEEWIGESTLSPFPQARYTERPDTAVAALLDGKIVAFVNGSPSILIAPSMFFEFFSSSEDYYQRAVFSSLIRFIRIGAFLMALLLPSTYIALTTFHSELIPTVLLLAILDTREGIPFPAFMEALIMEFFFEVLREAGIRLPRPIGSAVSIVGALVIGQAAIQTKIASPAMVIVVSLTGIANFSLPQYNMAIAIRILRFPFMLFAASMGGLGMMFGLLLTLLHLSCLRSLGQPYLAPVAPLDFHQLRDVVLMIPRKILLHSPRNRHLHKKTGARKKIQ
ncbi:spore germination protein [Paenibacillus aceris]|uniref:Spore germination protein KA n=1 Tax=Paenibacillus aceris TaxID=869555 RepID=A0ABS4I0X5_9BACL|nr:spore germination protein [Paenibacillus aceris]MBP1964567.1 spore germination protein KA [Paenibacillus aceris]NHW35724.1 spore germination protein [Paenibacillus aceris]